MRPAALTTPKKDVLAGGLLCGLGAFAIVCCRRYGFGTPMQIGPGFLPTILGAALMAIGLYLVWDASRSPTGDRLVLRNWRGTASGLLIPAGPMLFIALGTYGGLMPATFACVFVSAFADRSATLRGSFVCACAATVFGAVLFGWILRVPFPLLQWG